jgi:hypothetical protein
LPALNERRTSSFDLNALSAIGVKLIARLCRAINGEKGTVSPDRSETLCALAPISR